MVGAVFNNGGDVVSENQTAPNNLPADGAEWVDLFVKEMMSATNLDDARTRAARVLEVLEKSISVQAGAEATQTFQKVRICFILRILSSVWFVYFEESEI